MSGAKVFSVFDAKDSYWHANLTDNASKLTTFDAPLGRNRWLRMLYGIAEYASE